MHDDPESIMFQAGMKRAQMFLCLAAYKMEQLDLALDNALASLSPDDPLTDRVQAAQDLLRADHLEISQTEEVHSVIPVGIDGKLLDFAEMAAIAARSINVPTPHTVRGRRSGSHYSQSTRDDRSATAVH